jgi:hypothetical protein
MRLGLRPTVFEPGTETWSKARKLYAGAPKIWERHRHRYEVNPEYVKQLSESGCAFAGKDEKGERMQVLEIKGEFSVGFLVFSFTSLCPFFLHPFSRCGWFRVFASFLPFVFRAFFSPHLFSRSRFFFLSLRSVVIAVKRVTVTRCRIGSFFLSFATFSDPSLSSVTSRQT